MKPPKYLGAAINTRAALGAKPGGVEKTLKSGAPRHDGRSSKRAQADKRMADGAAALAAVWK